MGSTSMTISQEEPVRSRASSILERQSSRRHTSQDMLTRPFPPNRPTPFLANGAAPEVPGGRLLIPSLPIQSQPLHEGLGHLRLTETPVMRTHSQGNLQHQAPLIELIDPGTAHYSRGPVGPRAPSMGTWRGMIFLSP